MYVKILKTSRLFLAVAFFVSVCFMLGFSRSINLRTIMPDQSVLRVERGVVGDKPDDDDWDYGEIEIPEDSLLVGGRLGIGTDEVDAALINVGRTDNYGDDNILLLPPDDADEDQDYTRLKFHPGNLGGFINYEPDWGFTLRQKAHTGESFGQAQILRAYVPYWNDPRVGIGHSVHDTDPSNVGELLPKSMLSVGNLRGNSNAGGTTGLLVGPTGDSGAEALSRIELWQNEDISAALGASEDHIFLTSYYNGEWYDFPDPHFCMRHDTGNIGMGTMPSESAGAALSVAREVGDGPASMEILNKDNSGWTAIAAQSPDSGYFAIGKSNRFRNDKWVNQGFVQAGDALICNQGEGDIRIMQERTWNDTSDAVTAMTIKPEGNIGVRTNEPLGWLDIGDTSGFSAFDGVQHELGLIIGPTESSAPGNWGRMAMLPDLSGIAPRGGVMLATRGNSWEFMTYGGGKFHKALSIDYGSGDVTYSGEVTYNDGDSDARLKKNVEPLTGALDKILKLRGVNYEWVNPSLHSEGVEAGMIAQEIEEVFPEWVREIKPRGEDKNLITDSEKAKTYNVPREFNAYVVEAFREQQQKIEELKQELTELKEIIKSR